MVANAKPEMSIDRNAAEFQKIILENMFLKLPSCDANPH